MKTPFLDLFRALVLIYLALASSGSFVLAQGAATRVSLVTNDPQTFELPPWVDAVVIPARFLVQREGPKDRDLLVFFSVHGSAVEGKDYSEIGTSVRIPAGKQAAEIYVSALYEQEVENIETVHLRLEPWPLVGPMANDYSIDPLHSSATAVVYDFNDAGRGPQVDLAFPSNGDSFTTLDPIPLVAVAFHPKQDLGTVKFFVDGDLIAESSVILDKVVEGGLIHHRAAWKQPTAGSHILVARAFNYNHQELAVSKPVRFTVVRAVEVPVVSVHSLERWRTAEPCPVCLVAPGIFVLSRTGDVSEALPVTLTYDGTATPGKDYSTLPARIVIPAGKRSIEQLLLPIDDLEAEGPEIVRVWVLDSAGFGPEEGDAALAHEYRVDPENRSAMLVIGDNDPTSSGELIDARLDIIAPEEGAELAHGTSVQITALGVFTGGEINQGVAFYAGERLIGITPADMTARPPIPGKPSEHTVVWSNLPIGLYSLTARTLLTQDRRLVSKPVHIRVDGLGQSVVSIEATQRIAEETSNPFRRLRLNGQFTLTRDGFDSDPVVGFIHYSGTADTQKDVERLPFSFTIPAGVRRIEIPVEAIVDQEDEGIETLRATLSDCPPLTDPPLGVPCYNLKVDPAHDSAVVFLRDDGITEQSLRLITPRAGARFEFGDLIQMEAVAIDLNGAITRVTFWDGETQIGVSEIAFIRAPDPGTPIQHGFAWTDAAPGVHRLTARVSSTGGKDLVSNVVEISVGPRGGEQVVLEVEAVDAVATEPTAADVIDPAVFVVHRVGGDLDVEVTARYSLEGTAHNQIDYQGLLGLVTLKSGERSARVVVHPIADKAKEGEETVVIRLEPSICIAIFPPPSWCYRVGDRGAARAVIRDSSVVENTAPRIAIVQPKSGDQLPADSTVEIAVETRDPDGWVPRVEFFADNEKLGEANIVFIRPPDPGLLQRFSFEWRRPSVGLHVLTARATDDKGESTLSSGITVRVGRDEELPVVTVISLDPFAVEPPNLIHSEFVLNAASFAVLRSGSTDQELVVNVSWHGNAGNGQDYGQVPNQITIPRGSRSATQRILPKADRLQEWVETVVLKLEPSVPPEAAGPRAPAYRVGLQGVAVALIADDENLNPFPNQRCITLPGGYVYLCFPPQPDASNFRLEVSEDLLAWSTLKSGVMPQSLLHFIDEESPQHAQRFYRMVATNEP